MERGTESLTKADAKLLFTAWLWLLLGVVMCYFDLTPLAVAALLMMIVKLLKGATALLKTDT